MECLRCYKMCAKKSGVFTRSCGYLLIDVLIAISLATIFISFLVESSIMSNTLVSHAHIRSDMISDYENGTNVTMSVTSSTRLYGNNFLETNFSGLDLTAIYSKYSRNDIDASDNALCAVDFGANIVNSASNTPTFTQINLPIPATQPLTHLEVRNNIAYISTDSTQSSDSDLYLVDITNLQTPVIITSINTGPGIATFSIVGKNIYSAAASTAGQLHIISHDSPSSLLLEKKFQLPTPYATATLPYATAIGYLNNHIYLGTEKWDGPEFSVIDVSDISNPRVISSLEIGNKVDDIHIYGNIIYVSSAGQNQLRLIDTNNNIISVFTSSGWNRQEGKIVSTFEDNSAFGRTSGGYDIASDHELFYLASTSNATLSDQTSVNIPGGVYGIIQDRNNIFLATRQSGKEFQIYTKPASNASPSSSASSSLNLIQTYHLVIQPQSMTCDGHTIYVLAHDSSTIYAINF